MTTPHDTRLSVNTELLTRLFAHVQVSTTHFYKGVPCWEWVGKCENGGYAMRITRDHVAYPRHRLMYLLFVGHVQRGLHCDHLCRVRHCVNPVHIEPVTPKENVMRGVGHAARNAKKTHCVKGHPLSGTNLEIVPNGKHGNRRVCVTCKLAFRKHHNSAVYALPKDNPKRAKQIQQTKEWFAALKQLPYDHPRRVAHRASRRRSYLRRKERELSSKM